MVSINHVAIDLCESGLLEDAEALFRELVVSRYQVLEPGDFEIARGIGGLATTLEAAGKLEEALDYAQQAQDHRLCFEEADSWITNSERLDFARVLHKLQRTTQALKALDDIQISVRTKPDQDGNGCALLSDAAELRREIEAQQ